MIQNVNINNIKNIKKDSKNLQKKLICLRHIIFLDYLVN